MKGFFEKRSTVLFVGILILVILACYCFFPILTSLNNLVSNSSLETINSNILDITIWIHQSNAAYVLIITIMISAITSVIGYIYKKNEWLMASIITSVLFLISIYAIESGAAYIGDIFSLLFIFIIAATPTVLLIVGYINQNKINSSKKDHKKDIKDIIKKDHSISIIVLFILFLITLVTMIEEFIINGQYIDTITASAVVLWIFGDILILFLLIVPIVVLTYLQHNEEKKK